MSDGLETQKRPEAVAVTQNSPPTTPTAYFFLPFFGAGASAFGVASVNAMFCPT